MPNRENRVNVSFAARPTLTEHTMNPFTVWWRENRRSSWVAIVSAATEAEAVAEAVRRRMGGDGWVVMADGKDPNLSDRRDAPRTRK
jgi:hypothetical protein